MRITIRLLGPDDVAILARLAEEDADFDLDGRGGEEEKLSADDLRAYLSDPTVLHWIACDGAETRSENILGFLHGQTIRKYSAQPMELMLYEIGVRAHARRQGVGRALMDAMHAWMKERKIVEVWVLGDNPGAVAFYEACGYARHAADDAVYLTRELE